MGSAFLVTNGNTRFVPVWDDGLKEVGWERWESKGRMCGGEWQHVVYAGAG